MSPLRPVLSPRCSQRSWSTAKPIWPWRSMARWRSCLDYRSSWHPKPPSGMRYRRCWRSSGGSVRTASRPLADWRRGRRHLGAPCRRHLGHDRSCLQHGLRSEQDLHGPGDGSADRYRAIGVFVIVTSAIVWLILRFTIGIRASDEEQMAGLDKSELGLSLSGIRTNLQQSERPDRFGQNQCPDGLSIGAFCLSGWPFGSVAHAAQVWLTAWNALIIRPPRGWRRQSGTWLVSTSKAASGWRFDALPDYAFPRLRALLDGCPPGARAINLSLGEPRHPFPPFVLEALHADETGYGRYPPNEGTPDFRAACAAWLQRRFGLPDGLIDPEQQILPVNGTREALFSAPLAAETPKGAGRPAILIPNPYYNCYAGAALAAGASLFCRHGRWQREFARFSKPSGRSAWSHFGGLCVLTGQSAGQRRKPRLLGCAYRLRRNPWFPDFGDECYAEIYERDAADRHFGSSKRATRITWPHSRLPFPF